MNVQDGRVKEEQKSGSVWISEGEGRAALWVRTVFWGMVYGLWGYLLGSAELPFGSAPFGIALLSASDFRALYVFGGLCLNAVGSSEPMVSLSVSAAVLAVRILSHLALDFPHRLREMRAEKKKVRFFSALRSYGFEEPVGLRMATASVGVFAVGLWRLCSGGFLYYDLYGTILSVIAAPTAVLLMAGFFRKQKEKDSWAYRLGFLSLGSALCFAARDLTLYGISLGVFGAMFAVLYVSRQEGAVAGAVSAALFGLAVEPSLAPLFVFGALCASLLFPLSVSLGGTVSFLVSLGWGSYVLGFRVLNGVFPALLAAHFLFCVWDKLFGHPVAKHDRATAEATASDESPVSSAWETASGEERLRLRDTNRKIRALCAGFSDLGQIFEGLARRTQKPSASDLKQICDRAFDAGCVSCASKETCWNEQYCVTSAEVGEICSVLHQNGRVETERLEGKLRERCDRLPDIVEEINQNAARYTEQLLLSDRTEVFALDYRVMSRLLTVAVGEEEEEYQTDSELSGRLFAALREAGFAVSAVCAAGKRRRRIAVYAEDASALEDIHAVHLILESVCPFGLESGIGCPEEGVAEFWERPHLTVRYSCQTACADGEESYCGDTAEAFFGENGKFYALISDGMGSGCEAAGTSEICGVFLKKLLASGAECEEILHLLNGFLRNRGGGSLHECSATVDLMELDLMERRASFYKSGAAPTYVFRDGGLFKLRSRTVPIGIIRDPDVRKIGFEMGDGDLVVMVSDGVTQGKEECPWLFDLLRSHTETDDVRRLADLIVKYAAEDENSDDISVLVMKIEAA